MEACTGYPVDHAIGMGVGEGEKGIGGFWNSDFGIRNSEWGIRNVIMCYLQDVKSPSAKMKIFNLFLAAMFLLFAAVQFNDEPDDIVIWVFIYGGIGVISAFGAFNKYNMWVISLGVAVVVYELFRKFPTFAQWIGDGMPSITGEMKASTPHVELAREYLGLLLSFGILVFHYVRYSRLRIAKE